MDEKTIQLKQKPIIIHQLEKVGLEVTKRIADLNIEKQVATPDTIKVLKGMRADLNTEAKAYEASRKLIKDACNNPYNEFYEIYKVEIIDKFKKADSLLKDTILAFDDQIKEKKKNNIARYFNELCESMQISFIKFDQLGLKFDLSTSEKKYKEQCNTFMEKITDDLALIKSHEFEAEILVEYEKTLNASKSVTTVVERKEAARKKAEKLKIAEWSRRVNSFLDISMIKKDDTNTFEFNSEIYIGIDKVKDISKEEFEKVIIEFEQKIKDFLALEKKEEVKVSSPKEETKPEPKKEVVMTIKAPVVEEKLETVQVKFQVFGTLPELKALKQYLIDNNLTYNNL